MNSVDGKIKNVSLVRFENKSAVALQAIMNGFKVEVPDNRQYAMDNGSPVIVDDGEIIDRLDGWLLKDFIEFFDHCESITIFY